MTEILAMVVGILLGAAGVWAFQNRLNQPPQTTVEVVPEVAPQVEVIEDRPLPYWTAYGLPNYWPVTLSPYWFYDVPFYGPITGYWGGYDGVGASGGYRGRREKYAPHGWGSGYRGYSGVAVGGGGGGHGGGGGGGGGGHGGR